MRKAVFSIIALAFAGASAAAPNVTNATQKGTLLIFPDIRIDDGWNTLVRLQNDGGSDVDVKCYWMDGNKNRVDLIITVTRDQPFWFDARTGNGTLHVNRFPQSAANGFDNPFLIGPGGTTEATDTSGPYTKGLLACWAIDGTGQNQVKWNHLSGTATVYHPINGGYEYNAYAFFVPTGLDLDPLGLPGTLNLNGVEYDSCPLYQIGQFSPQLAGAPGAPAPFVRLNRLALTGCNLDFRQDWAPTWTKLQFDVWNEDEIKFTGAYECADSWHETLFGNDVDAGGQNFDFSPGLGTYSARYRVQGIKSTQCEAPGRVTQPVGVIAVHSAALILAAGADPKFVGTTLAAAGKLTGRIVWDPSASGPVPEGGIR